jgi:hypothetical protein
MVLCAMYLLVMIIFHSDIQDARPNPKHQVQPIPETEEVYPPMKKVLGNVEPESPRPVSPVLFRKPNTVAWGGFRDADLVQLPHVEVRHVFVKTEGPHSQTCIGNDVGRQFEFYELISNRLFLYSAYWDTRPNDFDNILNGTFIRIMSVLRWAGAKPNITCKFITNTGNELKTYAHYYEMCENHGRPLGGFIISCPVPPEISGQPCSVTLSYTGSRDPGYTMKVLPLHPRDNRDQFAICVPPLYGKIKRSKLVEFIEVSKLLGAQRIVFYDYKIADETARVLEHYQLNGDVDIIPWLYPESLEKWSWYHGQLIAIQDCLYRNMHTAEYVAFNDIDEYIVPHVHADWLEMTKAMFQPTQCAYQLPSAFFPPPPEYTNDTIVLASTRRSQYLSTTRTKCLVKPYMIYEKGIHHVSKPIWAHLQVVRMPEKIAFLHHYRMCMRDFAMNCKVYIDDLTMYKYEKEIKYNIKNTLHEL